MKTEEVRLKVVKHTVPKKHPPAVLPKPPKTHAPMKPSPLTLPQQTVSLESPKSSPDETSTPLDKQKVEGEANRQSLSSNNEEPASASSSVQGAKSPSEMPPSPFKKTPPIPPTRHPSTTLTNSTTSSNNKPRKLIIAPTNTKKIGKRVEIQLVKGKFMYNSVPL